MDLRDFYIFPYDMRHCVYPFNGTNETRRTLAANCDVQFDPIRNRGASVMDKQFLIRDDHIGMFKNFMPNELIDRLFNLF